MELELIRKTDPQVAEAIELELNRQRTHIELIASENFVSPAVMAAMGSCLTNKYAEGYPGKRYYGGCDCVDVVETLAIERAKELFGCTYANVQPGGVSDGNFVAALGVPTIDGMGPSGGMMCSPEEYLEIDTMVPCAARLALTLAKLGE